MTTDVHNNKIWDSKMNEWCDPKNLAAWSDEEICDFYDRNPNLTLLTFAGMLGLSGGELKAILMANSND
jgi:hypothetical protein